MAILTKTGTPVSTDSLSSTPSWQQEMKTATRDAASLLRQLGIPVSQIQVDAAEHFPVFAPPSFVARMRYGDANDPLLRQVLPVSDEDQSPANYSLDPLGELAATLRPGLIQKYQGRVLLVVTGACAIHCRYCFRRHFPYHETPVAVDDWQPALEAIAADPSIAEVILSGGDPLTLVDQKLAELVAMLDSISHVRRLRIHSRLPIVIPGRITDELTRILSETRSQTVLVIHSNHPNELDESVANSIGDLVKSGTWVLNQTVLLRGINDQATVLIELSERLLEIGALPYYLHQLDPVIGAAHFEVPVERGIQLIHQLRAELPGYAIPRYVREIEGQPNKIVLA